MFKNLYEKLLNRIFYYKIRIKRYSVIEYWEQRAKFYGSRAVLNIGHSEAEMNAVTERQKSIIFPLLKPYLNENIKIVLDFGCGVGRFSEPLALLTGATVIAIDPIKQFIELASTSPNVTFQHFDTKKPLPFADNSIDLLWICLVFGGIADEHLTTLVADLERILKPNGILILVENTSNQASSQYWSFRTVAFYEALFKTKKMNRVGSYIDVNEEISIMIGV